MKKQRSNHSHPGSALRWFGRPGLLSVFWTLLLAAPLSAAAPEDIFQFTDRILHEVSRLRGLEVLGEVKKGVKNEKEIRDSMEEMIRKEFSAHDIETERRLLVRLGLLPADYDYLQGVLDILDEQLAGYYDPEKQTLYLASWLPREQQEHALAHELMHALQDQHFRLNPFLEAVKGNDDAALARKALVEGEATAVALDHSLRSVRRDILNLPDLREFMTRAQEQNPRATALNGAPEFLREMLLFPYIYGARFMQVYRRWHSWEEVKELYQDPPRSTEQIIHPEKYAGRRDDPTEVDTTPVRDSLPGWNSLYSNNLGEFSLYQLLKQFIDEPQARRSARGWDGDAIELLQHTSGAEGFIFVSVWDDQGHAEQFFEACQAMAQTKFPEAEFESQPGHLYWAGPNLEVRIVLEGDRVSYFELDRIEPHPAPQN